MIYSKIESNKLSNIDFFIRVLALSLDVLFKITVQLSGGYLLYFSLKWFSSIRFVCGGIQGLVSVQRIPPHPWCPPNFIQTKNQIKISLYQKLIIIHYLDLFRGAVWIKKKDLKTMGNKVLPLIWCGTVIVCFNIWWW